MTRVPILAYHAVSADPPAWIAPYTVSPAVFAAHLDAVLASGRTPLTVSRYVDGLSGKAALPARPVLVTVDDGFADFAEHALPALATRGMASTLYVTTGALAGAPTSGAPRSVLPPAPMLRLADLPVLEATGVEVGCHSHTHRQLDLLAAHEVTAELRLSAELLAEALGHRARTFAYPHGYWRPGVRRVVGEAGFDSACAVGNALSRPDEDRMTLSRLMPRADTTAATVATWMQDSGAPVMTRQHRVLAFGWRQYRRARSLRAAGVRTA